MRPIDADALKTLLIDTLERIKEAPAMNGQEMHVIAACIMLNEMIDDAPTINHFPRQQWISVKGRLPDTRHTVLVCTRKRNNVPKIAMAYYENGFGWCGSGGRWNNVTHWMPLPLPPKGE